MDRQELFDVAALFVLLDHSPVWSRTQMTPWMRFWPEAFSYHARQYWDTLSSREE
jgi:hypothetical protein